MDITLSERHGVSFYSCLHPGWQGAAHGFSTRLGGISPAPWNSLNLGGNRGDDPARVRENFIRFCSAIGTDPFATAKNHQVHGDCIRPVTRADILPDPGLPGWAEADGLITNDPGVCLTVFSADCGIILLYDPVHQAIGAVHAGWRGCAAGIVEKTVQAMAKTYGSNPKDLLAAIGPCIGQCCFETDSDVPSAMRAALGPMAASYLEYRDPKWHVDLAGLNRQWLLKAGLAPHRIDLCHLCTACRPDLFWSHRKMGNARGAQVAMISL